MSAKENEELELTLIEALNTRELSQWSQKLSEDYAGEYPGVPVLNKTQSLERVMNLGENRIGMRIPQSAWFPRNLRFPHS